MDTKVLIATGAVAVALLAAPVARATLVLEFSVNGGPLTTLPCNPTGPGTCSVPVGFSVPSTNLVFQDGATAASQSPGPPNPDLLETTVPNLANLGTSAQTIELLVGDQGFTNPSGSGLNLLSSISGEVALSDPPPPPPSTLSYISCLDPANRPDYCSGGTLITVTTAPLQFSLVSGPLPPPNANNIIVTTSLAVPYSLTERFVITLQAGSTVSVTASTDVAPAPAVPEPASIALLGVGLFGMGFLRRRSGRASRIESNRAG